MTFTFRLRFILPIVAFVFICQAGEILHGQLVNRRWQARSPHLGRAFADVRPTGRGDLLVVTINQQSQVRNDSRRAMDKLGSSTIEADGNFALNGVIGSASGGGSVDEESNSTRRFQGNARQEITQLFSDQFTVVVIDSTPNGNFLIEGRRRLKIEGDERELVLSGIVRKFDINPDNTIASDKIANLSMRFESTGTGPEKSFANQGWFARKMNKFWGF